MEKLEHSKYYHIYNRGNNREKLFREPDNYMHFLRLYEKYINPIAETFAWVLMGNHFHLAVRIKDEKEILRYKLLNADRSVDAVRFKDEKWETASDLSACKAPDSVKKPNPTLHFSHLFNAYTKYFNKKYDRTGSLFERPFERKSINSENHFRNLIVYIHTNPVHHGFTDDFKDYHWSSYGSVISTKPTKLSRDKILGWFDDRANFIELHKEQQDKRLIDKFVIE
jgi:REP element-mobilizing transposase RayT